ncbi:MAG: hypothetical protein C4522_04835 [Desulfobacteraceae bacterium]|nr:MAG: hypothetical protein C4522_04835 [Desulfobacteraceae bacterium]
MLYRHKNVLPFLSMNHRKTTLFLYFPIIWIVLILLSSTSCALETVIGVNAGYDSNVNAAPEESGSSFTAGHIHLNHPISHEKAFGKTTLYLNSFYQHYSRFEDNMSVNAGAYYSCFPGSDRLMALALVEAGIYRDKEDAADELNQLKTGGQLKFFYNGKTTFQLAQFFHWNHYLEPAEYAVPTGSGNGNTDTGFLIQSETRNDCYMSSDMGVAIQLHPLFNMTVAGLYNRLYSSIQTEAYDGFGGSVYCRFSPDSSWGIATEALLWKNDFDDSQDRTDIFRSVNILINLFIDRYELFIRSDFMDNDSSLDNETYKRLVTRCGVSVFF